MYLSYMKPRCQCVFIIHEAEVPVCIYHTRSRDASVYLSYMKPRCQCVFIIHEAEVPVCIYHT